MVLAGAVISALLLGFLAGLLSFKKKSTWCETCGASLGCIECSDRRRAHVRLQTNVGPR